MRNGSAKRLRPKIKRACKAREPQLKELISKITPRNRHSEILSSSEVGREKVEWLS